MLFTTAPQCEWIKRWMWVEFEVRDKEVAQEPRGRKLPPTLHPIIVTSLFGGRWRLFLLVHIIHIAWCSWKLLKSSQRTSELKLRENLKRRWKTRWRKTLRLILNKKILFAAFLGRTHVSSGEFFWLKVEEKTVTCSSQVLQRQRPPSEDNIKAPA